MGRLVNYLLFALCTLLLAGCNLVSEEPLLPYADGETVFEDSFGVFRLSDGAYVDSSGNPSFLGGDRQEDGSYLLQPGDVSVSFHALPGMPFDYLIQHAASKQTTYYAARIVRDRLHVENIDLTTPMITAIETAGHVAASVDAGRQVSSREGLLAAVDTWARANYDRMLVPANYEVEYVIANGEEEAIRLMAETVSQFCLAAAGHPDDPQVKALPGKLGWGVELTQMDTEKARRACDWGSMVASEPRFPAADASTRYSALRVEYRLGNHAAITEHLDALVAEDFHLAILLKADMLIRGDGYRVDRDGARDLLETHGEDDPLLRYHLARYIVAGAFGPPDHALARQIFEGAAADGTAAAFHGLGEIYAEGRGVGKDEKRALALFEQGAAAGDRQAMRAASDAYYFGRGAEQNYEKSYAFAKSAAERGVTAAQYSVGFMLAHGQGVTKSESEAVTWHRRAEAAGSVASRAELGRHLYHGIGVTADPAKGRALLEQAAKEGSGHARKYLDAIDKVSIPSPG
jgi:hypothetical protein